MLTSIPDNLANRGISTPVAELTIRRYWSLSAAIGLIERVNVEKNVKSSSKNNETRKYSRFRRGKWFSRFNLIIIYESHEFLLEEAEGTKDHHFYGLYRTIRQDYAFIFTPPFISRIYTIIAPFKHCQLRKIRGLLALVKWN